MTRIVKSISTRVWGCLFIIVLLTLLYESPFKKSTIGSLNAGVFPVELHVQPGKPVVPRDTQKNTFDEYKKSIQPFLKKYCWECHGPDEQMGKVGFHRMKNGKSLFDNRRLWEKVVKKLESSAMPPADHDPKPTAKERKRTVKWLDETLFHVDCTQPHDPGKVTLRRLNRAEYNNTIRDLFRMDLKPAKDFPSDDVGNGFDNMGDVLTISPLLMEKYLNAAEEITTQAIPVLEPNWQRKRRVYAEKLKTDTGRLAGDPGVIVLFTNGSAFADFDFPGEGEYTFRVKAFAQQAGPDLARLEFRLGKKKLKSFEIKTNRKKVTVKCKVKVSKGRKRFSAAFVNDYYRPSAKNPQNRDRNMGVFYLEVEAPANVLLTPRSIKKSQIIFTTPGPKQTVKLAATKVLSQFMKRAFRRPLKPGEVDRYENLVANAVKQGDSFEEGIRWAIQGILVSPHFLFRIEDHLKPKNSQDSAVRIDDYSLACRLSYFLWSSMPDEELFALAEKGILHRSEIITQQTKRMLKDQKSQALVQNFAQQWLNLRLLDDIFPDPRRFRAFNTQLRLAMKKETELFFAAVMKEDRSILDFLDGNFTFVNETLAKHYGIKNIRGKKFRRVTLPANQRRGILTHASILTITSNPTRTSPVKRGKWIMENILGTPPQPPPPGVPKLDEAKVVSNVMSLRKQLELHAKNPICASCHLQMDALGFGFENFDAIGRWRERDGRQPIDSSGELPSGEKFRGPVQLVAILKKKQDEFSRSLSKKLLTYALGRGLEYYDKCTVDEIVSLVKKNDYRFSSLVLSIVQSRPFTMTRSEGKSP